MPLQQLEVRDVRCLKEAVMELSPGVNLVCGANGSGKTSLLEAVYLLGTGRSFRTRDPDEIIRDGEEGYLVRGAMRDGTGRVVQLALQRTAGRTSIRYDGEVMRSAAQLAGRMPVTLVTPDTHVEMQGQAKARRRWLDITLFHVKPGYLDVWKRLMRGIKHRNALLRRKGPTDQLEAWDAELVHHAERLDALRQQVAQELFERAAPMLRGIFTTSVSMHYHRGWPDGESYREALNRGREADAAMGITRLGPHRADIGFEIDGRPIASRLSRGQLKVWMGLLMLAQVLVIATNTQVRPLVLLDDLVSDLDGDARRRLLCKMAESGCQLFVTAVDEALVPLPDAVPAAVFHVKQGEISRSV